MMNAINKIEYIECAKLYISDNQIMSNINTINYKLYDIYDVYGAKHLLILRKNNNEFIAFLSGNEMLNNDLLKEYIK